MSVLVVGASGATGTHLLAQLLDRGEHVKAVIRPTSQLPEDIKNNANLSLTVSNISEMGTN